MTMSNTTEDSVRQFYDEYGWARGGEDELFREFRPAYKPYHEGTIARTRACFGSCAGRLLIVGCGDMPRSHVELGEQFAETICFDISRVALDIAAQRLPKAKTRLGSICEAPFPDATFDAVFASHIIYHIDASLQEQAVREMIRVVKPGGRVVVLYSNPKSPIRYAAGIVHRLRKLFAPKAAVKESGLYFSPHTLGWWKRFSDSCDVSMKPWDVIGSYEERTLIPADRLAPLFYSMARVTEKMLPKLAVRIWQYPIIVLGRR